MTWESIATIKFRQYRGKSREFNVWTSFIQSQFSLAGVQKYFFMTTSTMLHHLETGFQQTFIAGFLGNQGRHPYDLLCRLSSK